MIKILGEGDGKHRIENGHDERIGWIRDLTIGFRGFATEADAREAAIAARRALDRAILSHHNGWPVHEIQVSRLHTVHDGAYEWLFDGTMAVARLLRPHRRAFDASFGIELVLPSFANEGLAVAAAHSLCLAVEPYRDEHGIAAGSAERRVPAGAIVDTSTFY